MKLDYKEVLENMKGKVVDRPNKSSEGTLSGHAAGEPFEKEVYHTLKTMYPDNIYKQYEYLNDLYLKNPKVITLKERRNLLESPTVLYLLSRGDKATREWSPTNVFEEKQNDTADILFHYNGLYELIDVKTRNISKDAMAPNIISAYKLAKACAYMLDNKEFDNIHINYIEIDWTEYGDCLKCVNGHFAELFLASPDSLYINWAAAMQIQFHVCDLDQTWKGTLERWAREYIKVFVNSAQHRCDRMKATYITPFLKYIK
jgi:type II restriction enzyme